MTTEPVLPNSLTPKISLKGICKQFPGVLANDHIDLDIYKSEIHALLGENGAGKSTLMKILYGFYRSDEGSIWVDGREVQIKSPSDARKCNIGMVFQVLNLIPAMTVLENIALFLKDLPAVYNPQKLRDQILDKSKQYGLEIKPDEFIYKLSLGEQQKVEILKLLLSNAQVLILDEPTRVLAPHEVETLLGVIKRLKQDDYSIVLIAHKLKEVLACADKITVLRGGRVGGFMLGKDASEEKLIKMMFEKQLSVQIKREESQSVETEPILELESVCTQSERTSVSLKNINLKIRSGEIVGIAGVSGNGQKELCDAILGLEKINSGKKLMGGLDFTRKSPGAMRSFGLGFIPENPLTMAMVPFMPVIENMALTRTAHYSKYCGFGMDWKLVREDTRNSLEKFGFSFSYYIPAKALSGGNLQKLIVAREMAEKPRLIIASYLTRGLDVQSALVARRELMHARNEGAGVLLISEDLEELFELSDRLIVLFEGQIVGEFKPAEIDTYQIGHLMTGSKGLHDNEN